MPRFYFDIENTSQTIDTNGEEHEDAEAAIRAGMVILAEVALEDARSGTFDYGVRVVIRNGDRQVGKVACRFWRPTPDDLA